jgi:hypothetical protein
MERKKLSNYMIFVATLAIIAVFLITKTVMVINDRHEEKQLYAMHSKVEYYAKKCYLDDICKDKITLEILYENGYLTEEVVNPITKEVIDHGLEIYYENEKVVINW